jgi:hypothetical protein
MCAFLSQIMIAVRSLRKFPSGMVIAPELAEQFEAADAWLKPFYLQ